MIRCTALTLAILLTLSAVPAHAMTYYVDAAYGNDNYSGLSPFYIQADIGPVKTLAKAFEKAQSVGDTIITADGIYSAPPEMGPKMEAKGITVVKELNI